MTVMLVIVVVAIYIGTIGGSGGTEASVKSAGSKLNGTIEAISP